MGYTICYDTLVKKAKKKKFKSNVEPGQEDTELNKAVKDEKKNMMMNQNQYMKMKQL